jgi:DNA-binding NtrC family response regulator
LESELFGHERGSFTGAYTQRIGRFEEARGGSILLDEIAEMPLSLQAKLLRVTQDGRFQRVGSNRDLQSDARIFAATNRVLDKEVEAGKFREDLFYRLNVVEIFVPPLRERREDILPLATQFARQFTRGEVRFSPAVIRALEQYRWPGNIRELRNAMERAALLSHGELILPEHLPARIRQAAGEGVEEDTPASNRLEDVERSTILQALREHGFNRSEAARALGISRRALLYKIQRFRELGYDVGPAASS